MSPLAILFLILLFASGIGLIVFIMLHSGKGTGISDMIASAGQLTIPDIAAGTVIPYKTKIDTSGAEIDASATLSDNFSGIDERLSDLNDLLQKVLTAIIEHGDVYLDLEALSKMLTKVQKGRMMRYGGA